MSDLFASVAGHRVIHLHVHIPNIGAWYADADLEEKTDLTGRVEIKIGRLTLVGTVSQVFSGSFALATKLRIVAGAGGWAKGVPAKAYHNDAVAKAEDGTTAAGVKASTILEDAAREVGETLEISIQNRVGVDFVRRVGPASHVLEQVLGSGAPWRVDYDGLTRIGARPPVEVVGSYELLQYDPQSHVATIALDDPTIIGIGSILRSRLDAPATVRELELVIDGGKFRVFAWCGGDASAHSRIGRGLRAIAQQTQAKLFGSYRYRVVDMLEDRARLQAVRKAAGLPDILPVSLFPGMAGLWADLTPGAVVLVTFIEGDASAPILTHFEAKGGPGFLPVSLLLDATDTVNLGPSAKAVKLAAGILEAARRTDPVQCGPFTGMIMGGSAKTKIG